MKAKQCKCGDYFVQYNSLDKYCSPKCAYKFAKPLNKKSDKRTQQEEKYKIIRQVYLLNHPLCARCGDPSTEVHHTNGRNDDRLNDKEFFMSSCRSCHEWIHDHPKQARKEGWLI